ncbi:DUF4430 domain-containing protein [Enorma burkinafasonensis]|uniref:DUF4430 domain-containing protein n=1 Tax=Enorma burkinafasonensis TaxID=2590867 RepID=UPI0026EB1233|nr:DUF4430 domain-containing protein [Enorma burkinafasonensis]MCI7730612.1 DUF4430 domain-containing protein [Enorma burkinafasonensis]
MNDTSNRPQNAPDSASSKPFISLDGDASRTEGGSGDTGRCPGRPGKSIVLGAGAVLCVALIVLCLGFIHPSDSGGWSVAWLFQTTEDVAPQGSAAAGEMEPAGEEASSEEGSSAADEPDAAASGVASGDEGSTDGSGQGAAVATGATGTASSSGAAGGDAPSSQDTPATAPSAPATVTVGVSVSSSAVGNPVSASGTFTFEQGATVYDALCALGLPMNAQGSQFGVYVSAIGGLAEKEHGDMSGWVYTVNGNTVNTSASSYVLSDGDQVSWFYVV